MKLTTQQFQELMQTGAAGWSEGNARKASHCFHEAAINVEPPELHLYRGPAQLYDFFGGNGGTDVPMEMTWQHLAFHEEDQFGFGEYTFQMHGRYHGIVVVRLAAGLINRWRESQYRSELDWEEFTSQNPF